MSCVSLLLGVEGVPQELIEELNRSVRRKLRVRRVHNVCIDSLHSSVDIFRDNAVMEAYEDPRKREQEGFFEAHVLEQQTRCLAYAFGRYGVKDVVVIVYGHCSSENDRLNRWEWATGRVGSRVPAYQVHQSESNPKEFYLVGRGFGDTINVVEREVV